MGRKIIETLNGDLEILGTISRTCQRCEQTKKCKLITLKSINGISSMVLCDNCIYDKFGKYDPEMPLIYKRKPKEIDLFYCLGEIEKLLSRHYPPSHEVFNMIGEIENEMVKHTKR